MLSATFAANFPQAKSEREYDNLVVLSAEKQVSAIAADPATSKIANFDWLGSGLGPGRPDLEAAPGDWTWDPRAIGLGIPKLGY